MVSLFCFLLREGVVVVLTGGRGITGWNGKAHLCLGHSVSCLWIVMFLWSIYDFSCFSQLWEDKKTLLYYFSWNLKIIHVIEIIWGCLLFSVSRVDVFCPYSSTLFLLQLCFPLSFSILALLNIDWSNFSFSWWCLLLTLKNH